MEDNVVSLDEFKKRKQKEDSSAKDSTKPTYFKDLAEKNKVAKEKLKKERETNNKSVLKSYRLK